MVQEATSTKPAASATIVAAPGPVIAPAPADTAVRLSGDSVDLQTGAVIEKSNPSLLSRAVSTVTTAASDVKEFANEQISDLHDAIAGFWERVGLMCLSWMCDERQKDEKEEKKKTDAKAADDNYAAIGASHAAEMKAHWERQAAKHAGENG